MKNKLIILIGFILVFILAFCACNDSKKDSSNDTDTKETEQSDTVNDSDTAQISTTDKEDESEEVTEPQGECEHSFGEWINIKEPTCKEKGEKTRKCSKCGKEQKEFIPKAKHTSVTDSAVAATCEQDGLTEGSHCSVCNKTLTAQTRIPASHTDDEWIIETPASCEREGSRYKLCLICRNKIKEEVIPITHSYVDGFCQCGSIEPSEGLTFLAVSGGYSVTGIESCEDEFLVIPNTYKGQPVIEIYDSAFCCNRTIKKVFIPSTISRIGAGAFSDCSVLADIIFEENSRISTIDDIAFSGCAVASVSLPEGLEYLGRGAFNDCKSLEEITLPTTLKSIGKNAFRTSTNLSKVYIKDVAKWCGISFEDKNANPAYIAKNIYSLDGELITDLVIPEGVRDISAFAFYGVESIEKVTFPNSIEKIIDDAFYGCSYVTEIHISDIAAWCKVYIKNENTLPNAKLYLNENEITNLIIPDTVRSIGSYAFAGFSSIVKVTINDSVTVIGEGAFMSCSNLEEITLPNELLEIPKKLLYANTKLKSITIPNTVTKIGESAFASCNSIREFFIPESVTYIGLYAFENCSGIEEFVFECKAGWEAVYSSGDTVTIYSYMLENSNKTIETVNKYDFAYWRRV